MARSKSDITYKLSDIPEEQLKDPNDCHRIPFLNTYLGERSIIVTTKGTVKGRLQYLDGWYYCQAPFRLVGGEWQYSHYRFCFRKGQFRSIKKEKIETSLGV